MKKWLVLFILLTAFIHPVLSLAQGTTLVYLPFIGQQSAFDSEPVTPETPTTIAPAPTAIPTSTNTPTQTPTQTPTVATTTTIPQPPGECVNINTATVDDLRLIIHIDDVRAQEMLTLRPFSSVDDMIRISGIGPVRLQEIRDEGLACVDEG
jgi:hypothetical protein